MKLLNAMKVGFWVSLLVVAGASIKFLSCINGDGGTASCGTLPHLLFLLGTILFVGTAPIFLIGLLDMNKDRESGK